MLSERGAVLYKGKQFLTLYLHQFNYTSQTHEMNMAFGRLGVIVALAASQLGSAAVTMKRSVTCSGGQTTANEACCG